ncbi:MAG: NADH-quinone oxidoreductase subunit N [Armatimonadetes bacterium]|nr:NADH-quinone oxidoreductase subunit N [Armatimonadota bacterium]MDW8121973.1 NADH-quinone oxidoreductase subunit N [Armatimonadota bacterium]
MTFKDLFILLLGPELWLTFLGFFLFTLDLIFPRAPKKVFGLLTLLAFVGGLVLVAAQVLSPDLADEVRQAAQENRLGYWLVTTFSLDGLATFSKGAIFIGAILIALVTVDYVEKNLREGIPEFYGLMVFSVLALCFMVSSVELITLFLAIEFASISSYILAAYLRGDPKSSEAAMKYFLVGATTTAAGLYGMSLIYAGTGTTYLYEMTAQFMPQLGETGVAFSPPLPVLIGLLMMLATLGFKVAMVPFHGWCPDAYEGAPTPITAFLSVASKIAGMATLMRVFASGFGPLSAGWVPILAFLSLVTMTFGNLAALWQTNVKRLMAYSSISQVGYLLIGVAAFSPSDFQTLLGMSTFQGSEMALPGIFYFLLGYAFANMGAFAVIIWVENWEGATDRESFEGLAQRSPVAAALLTLSFLSLIGIPPLAGFFGKFFLFGAALSRGLGWLAIAGVVNSVISAFYYLEVVRRMYFFPPRRPERVSTSLMVSSAAVLGVVGAFAIGILTEPAYQWAMAAFFDVVFAPNISFR